MIVNNNTKDLIRLLSENKVPFDMEFFQFEDGPQLQICCPSHDDVLVDSIIVKGGLLEILDWQTGEVFENLSGVGAFYIMWGIWDKYKDSEQ